MEEEGRRWRKGRERERRRRGEGGGWMLQCTLTGYNSIDFIYATVYMYMRYRGNRAPGDSGKIVIARKYVIFTVVM